MRNLWKNWEKVSTYGINLLDMRKSWETFLVCLIDYALTWSLNGILMFRLSWLKFNIIEVDFSLVIAAFELNFKLL